MYGLSSDDVGWQARARELADALIPHEVEAELAGGWLPTEVRAEHHGEAVARGLVATNIPTEAGGQGCTMLQQVLVQEQAGRVTNALGWVMATPPAWWVDVATDLQRERWLLPTVRGEQVECYAITEEHAGSDVADLAATARRDGDSYVLDGEKWHVTSYNEASYAFVQAVLTDGPHAGEHAIVAFEGVRVPEAHRVGAEGEGMVFAQEWFRFERLMVAARCLGAADRLVEEVSAFASERMIGGAPLAQRQLVQGMLADSLTELFAARSMVYETARGVDAGQDRKVLHAHCSMAKLYASEMAGRVADRAVQVFGGRGYMRENVAERFSRELRVERIWEGASEVQRVIVADQLAKRGLRALI